MCSGLAEDVVCREITACLTKSVCEIWTDMNLTKSACNSAKTYWISFQLHRFKCTKSKVLGEFISKTSFEAYEGLINVWGK